MNRIILLTAAALAVAFAQPVYAHGGGGGGGGGHFGGGGGGHFGGFGGGGSFGSFGGGGSHFHGGSVAHFGDGRFGGGSSFQHAPLAGESAFGAGGRSSFQRQVRQTPTMAFGGSAGRNAGQAGFHHLRAPVEVARNWDRGQIHNWNHHRFRFFNNGWFAIDGGYDYPYGYDYGYDSAPYGDSYDDLASDQDPDAPSRWSVAETGSLPVAVQRELARRGYHPCEINGVLGTQTRNAIAAFQNDQRLPVTGRIDPSVLSALHL